MRVRPLPTESRGRRHSCSRCTTHSYDPLNAWLDQRHTLRRGSRGAGLSWTTLTRADLTNATLTHANMRFARLRSAKLANAELDGADLCGAALKDADLRGANLTGANMRNITGPIQAVATTDGTTLFGFFGSDRTQTGLGTTATATITDDQGAEAAPSAARCPSMRAITPTAPAHLSRTSPEVCTPAACRPLRASVQTTSETDRANPQRSSSHKRSISGARSRGCPAARGT
ncbi:pentapeptide repeat-containing protein [Streptosporangium sp. G11]|uniref:pentapeptide repeat-containing protein n=1 Tax=Streptosporangium sp. G11 TaxID=3436926 RepID=UPI003EB88944